MRRNTILPILAAIVALGGIATATYLDLDQRVFEWLERAWLTISDHAADQAATAAHETTTLRAGAGDTRDYEISHGIGPDPRLVDGAATALATYARLFGIRPNTVVYVRTSGVPADENTYRVRFIVGLDQDERTYVADFSTRPEDLNRNLDRLVSVLRSFSHDFPQRIRPPEEVLQRAERGFDPLPAPDLIDLSGNWVKELDRLNAALQRGHADPAMFRHASTVYAWLALFKDWHEDQTLSHLLAAEAVGTELLARLLEAGTPPTLNDTEGLLWLALHYEKLALEALERAGKASNGIGAALAGYIRLDLAHLDRSSREQKGELAAISGYLLARAYGQLRQNREAEAVLDRILGSSPGFLEARLYRVSIANLGDQRATMRSAMQSLMLEHWSLGGGNRGAAPAQGVDLSELFMGDLQLLNRRVTTLMTEHRALMEKLPVSQAQDRLVRGDLLRNYARQDFLNACLMAYRMYEVSLGIYEHAQAIAEAVRDTYPDSDLSRMFELRLLEGRGELHEALRQARHINVQSAGPVLLREMLRLYGIWDDARIWPSILKTLEAYQLKESPDSQGSRRLAFYYYHSLHRATGIAMFRRAADLNPYDIYAYRDLADYEKSRKPLEEAEPLVGHVYAFLGLTGDWYARQGDTDRAVRYYERAIAASPTTYTAYEHLTRLYRKRGQADQAVRVLRRYLGHDRDTLDAVDARNGIGYIQLERNQLADALRTFSQTRTSYQNDALLGYALSRERLGQLAEARATLAAAADRYPVGPAPVRLALFDLRHDHRDEAIQTLSQYSRLNRPSYYFADIIDYYSRLGQSDKAVELVRAVNRNETRPIVLYELADTYNRKNLPQVAAAIHRELARSGNDAFLHAALYYDNSLKARPDAGATLLAEAEDLLPGDPDSRGRFTLALVRLGHHRAAFDALGRLNPPNPEMSAHHALMQGLYWRLARLGPDRRAGINRQALATDPWRRLLLEYLLGETDQAHVLAQVTDARRYLMAHFYIGVDHMLNDRLPEAMRHLRAGLTAGTTDVDEQFLAYSLLARLDGKTTDWCCRVESY